ncbi:AbrB/MazE/SpoVT family DNA-binding domain-containing protein (plasmid) [Streptomyces viridifaciens]|nr:AbrB/MazE/SpoVT family DNA-binding domain-containing protein [Streptomyces viridifaciens]
MDQNTRAATMTVVGQRGRLIIPAALQRAAGIAEGTRVAIRATEDGTTILEPTWAVAARLRRTVGPLLRPQGEVSVRWGGRPGRPDGVRPTDLLLPATAARSAVERALGFAEGGGTDLLVVLTASAVLGWLTGADGTGPGSAMAGTLPYAVLPEQAVAQLVTVLVRAGGRDEVDMVLADLQLLGLKLTAPGEGHADLAHDTATALALVTDAARDGVALDFTDALCTAVALRLGLLLLAAGPAPVPSERGDQPESGE